MYRITRETQHGRSYYKAGRWNDQPREGHIYKSLRTAFKAHAKLLSQYPGYRDIVTIARAD